ncbi:MAG TPA: SET domain-containing protein [Verrucomicrobiae bacterium]|nr:SET domain-containing protein [Verrucomicrobiae bacterium]
MLHPNTELRHVNTQIGYGVFATRKIPKGTITWVRDDLDQTFEPDEIQQFRRDYRDILEKYTFVDRNGIAVLCWDLARYMNHSCEANCLGAGYEFEVAIRDIEVNEELTDDYGTLNLRESFPCFCQNASCRGNVQPDDLTRLWEGWDVKLRAAFCEMPRLDQPLRIYLKSEKEIDEAARDPLKMRSCRFNYFPSVYQEPKAGAM